MTRNRIQAHSSNRGRLYHVTKVLLKNRILWIGSLFVFIWIGPSSGEVAEGQPNKPAESLYLQLGQVGLDPSRVYQVRGASLNRGAVQITMDDGIIGFTQDIMGRTTGAFFEGDGEILLTPPDAVERRSMSLFTGMAILEERFATAYFRFNDDAVAEMRPDLRATDNKQEFVDRWGTTARNLASADAMRLMMSFSRMLPVSAAGASGEASDPRPTDNLPDRFLHARLQGIKVGVFDVYFDSMAPEAVEVGQAKTTDKGDTYYDVWTSFSPTPAKLYDTKPSVTRLPESEETNENSISILRYKIATDVLPPKEIHARALLDCEVRRSGARTLLFELSRFLRMDSVKLDGIPVEFIHNPALEGTQLSRQGNDLVAVILPEPAVAGKKFALEFTYGGEVLAEAGSGLLYVGARGTWYPNQGIEMADFDLKFSYPQGWTLVATGKPTQISADDATASAGQQMSRWVSERSIPLAGFNLGKYREATTKAGDVAVKTYATQGVEKNFPSGSVRVIEPIPSEPIAARPPQVIVPPAPSPALNEVNVGESAARAIQYFADRFGPFPYSQLALTQMPGRESQGWPGLVFLSSYAFLNDQEREQLHFEPYRILIQHSIPAHEVAHQWWGDLITWNSYRDQWFSEGLANYCALMMLQEKNPAGFRRLMEQYRTDLSEKNKDGLSPKEAGPVTLGTRLLSSHFPEGYEAISYGRGTWLFHMLRTMLKDAAAQDGRHATQGTDEPFVRALRKARQRYEGKAIGTDELLAVFEEELPPSLRYEGKRSLEWFLDGWINGTAMPKLELKGVKFTPKGAGATVSGTILQNDAPPDLVTSVPVYAVIAGKQPILLGRVFADGAETSFRLPAPLGSHKIALDPYDTILTGPK
jgi:hypothetical protein